MRAGSLQVERHVLRTLSSRIVGTHSSLCFDPVALLASYLCILAIHGQELSPAALLVWHVEAHDKQIQVPILICNVRRSSRTMWSELRRHGTSQTAP